MRTSLVPDEPEAPVSQEMLTDELAWRIVKELVDHGLKWERPDLSYLICEAPERRAWDARKRLVDAAVARLEAIVDSAKPSPVAAKEK